ncbi:Ubiquitin-protein ligase, putative [Hondaea fermentalgiana]|uniref:HECT-type E3 ubiquitin transferase n=1 Tax=Hondaea fermentalgiana TaxID=2315210 RepID=A0A2R5GYU5_9STRA|nr:Ubiquitin-protein ligase, putative [Hondaea fermentalgiana]|eukprot:GBG33641.1 Ubiquitin-protein ligase, putative [Hondaea fermentalgiana]
MPTEATELRTPFVVDELSIFDGSTVRTAQGWSEQVVFTTENGNVFVANAQAGRPAVNPLNLPGFLLEDDGETTGSSHIVLLTDLGRVFAYASSTASPYLLENKRNEPIVQIVCTQKVTLLLGHSGRVHAHGASSAGDLGLGDKVTQIREDEPARQVEGGLKHVAVQRLAAGPSHVLALTASGRLLAWGDNDNNQQGSLRPVKISWPLPIDSDKFDKIRACDVACGDTFIAVLTRSGRLHILGCGLAEDATFAPSFGNDHFKPIVAISAGKDYVAALHDDGEVTVYDVAQSLPRQGVDAKETLPLVSKATLPAMETEHGAARVAVLGNIILAFGANEEAAEKRLCFVDEAIATTPRLCLILESLGANAERVVHADQTRLFLVFLCTPLAQMGGDEALLKLVRMLDRMEKRVFNELFKWIFKEVDAQALATYLVEPLVKIFSQEARASSLDGSPDLITTAKLLHVLYNINETHAYLQIMGRLGHVPIDRNLFTTNVLLEIDPTGIDRILYRWQDHISHPKSKSRTAPFSILQYPFLISVDTKSEILRLEGSHVMMERYQGARRRGQQATLVLSVRRNRVFMDTIRALAATDPVDMKMPLQVKFEGEEGVDAGGVKKEFFELLSTTLFDPHMGVFNAIDIGGTEKLWFTNEESALNSVDLMAQFIASGSKSPDEVDKNELYMLVGQLIGLAIYNNTILDVQFPITLYRILLRKLPEQPSLMHLHELDPALARGLQSMLDYDGDDVETVFGADFAGLRPGGENEPVSNENRNEYVAEKIAFKLHKEFFPIIDKLLKGFETVVDRNMRSFQLFEPEQLELALTGSDALDIDELRVSTEYDGGYTSSSRVVKWFWQIVKAWDKDKQRELLRFATGAPRAPVGGLQSLRFSIQRAGPDSDQLPTASTCFNHLLLPDYFSKQKLANKLDVALNNAQGFGLS